MMGKYIRQPPTSKPIAAVCVILVLAAVIGIVYQIAGEPIGCVSVAVNVIVFGSVMLIADSCSVRLGDGLLAVTVTLPVNAALGVKVKR